MNQRRIDSKIEVIMHPIVQEVYELIKALRPKAEAWDYEKKGCVNPYASQIEILTRTLSDGGALNIGPPPAITYSPLTGQEAPMGPSPIGINDKEPFTYPPKQGNL